MEIERASYYQAIDGTSWLEEPYVSPDLLYISNPVSLTEVIIPPMYQPENPADRFIMQIDLVDPVTQATPCVNTQHGTDNFADLPDFRTGLAETFDPEVTGSRVAELEAEYSRQLAKNQRDQAVLLTGSAVERLEAKAQLDALADKIAVARHRHEVATFVSEGEKARAADQESYVVETPELPELVEKAFRTARILGRLALGRVMS